ncbi:MAG: heparinase II/III family protein [Paracoccaceae bacterium]
MGQLRTTSLIDRVHARLAGPGRAAGGFASMPEPWGIGSPARGRQIVAGNLLIDGHLIEIGPHATPWGEGVPAQVAARLHAFDWLADLAAHGDHRARARATAWTAAWIDGHGGGTGPGWAPGTVARRLTALTLQASFVLRGQGREVSDPFYGTLARHATFLARRWRGAERGLPRIEALTALSYAALSLMGLDGHLESALDALEAEADRTVDQQGGIESRNAEELAEILARLVWIAASLEEAGHAVPDRLALAIGRAAGALRTLRLPCGGLPRLHGGGRGTPGRLDAALAAAGRGARPGSSALGVARLSAGRTGVAMDVAPPPGGPWADDAHASTLCFELSSGRRPVIVSTGPGHCFGDAWRQSARATPSHSGLSLDGASSATFAGGRLSRGPSSVEVARPEATRIVASHDGWLDRLGLLHTRALDLSDDGRALSGEDALSVPDAAREVFAARLERAGLEGIGFDTRFHLHPDVRATVDLGGTAVSLALPSGEVWVLRHDGTARLSLAPSVALESARIRPRATRQVVLSGRVTGPDTLLRWSLAKARDTADTLRDLAPGPDDDPADRPEAE